MNAELVSDQLRAAFEIAFFGSAIPLAASFVCGLIMSILQAATQLQDQTLSFVPKLCAVFCAVFLCSPFVLESFDSFVRELLACVQYAAS